MGLCREFVIDHKVFEFRKENERWWRITKRSSRVVKYISLDHETMGWLGSMVKECAASLGSAEFLRTRRKGNMVLMVRRGSNYYGSFIVLSEFGHDKRRGMIVVPEGRKGEGWRYFGDTVNELSPPFSSTVSQGRNRTLSAFQEGSLKLARQEGGDSLLIAGGARSYSEALKAQKVQSREGSAVVPATTSPEIVQNRGVVSNVWMGSNEESILGVLNNRVEKIGLLLDEIVWLKRSVKGKEVLQNGMGREGDGLGLGAGKGKPVMGPGMGSGVGQAVGPKKYWKQRNRARPEISGLGPSQTLAAPISVSPAPTPSQKEPPVTVDHHGVPLGPFRQEEGEDSEVTEERLISRVVFSLQLDGFFVGEQSVSAASGGRRSRWCSCAGTGGRGRAFGGFHVFVLWVVTGKYAEKAVCGGWRPSGESNTFGTWFFSTRFSDGSCSFQRGVRFSVWFRTSFIFSRQHR
ncbi:hypothetical protein F2P56_020633 [Juglans regia]|uniref:DUF4283 domain-containing protein n=1 Tax=Juglans regia TaxID=51240 RepID=A0A833U517_JUGRE|nr:hypothetical protein F2P56_020633 [Juglans regia]